MAPVAERVAAPIEAVEERVIRVLHRPDDFRVLLVIEGEDVLVLIQQPEAVVVDHALGQLNRSSIVALT